MPQPLKVLSTPSKSTKNVEDKTPIAPKQPGSIIPTKDISSPHELTAFVSLFLALRYSEISDNLIGRNAFRATRL